MIFVDLRFEKLVADASLLYNELFKSKWSQKVKEIETIFPFSIKEMHCDIELKRFRKFGMNSPIANVRVFCGSGYMIIQNNQYGLLYSIFKTIGWHHRSAVSDVLILWQLLDR